MSRDVGVGQLVAELEQRGDRLPFEIGAFVALEACEGLLRQSVRIEPDDVRVTIDGSVVLAQSVASAEPEEAARSLVSVLARLLVAAGPGVPPYLLQLVKDSATSQEPRGLRDLHDAIEASLIPINRSASRRVLARLVRESDRPPAPEVPHVDPDELDAELDELLRDPVLRTQGPEPNETALRPQRPEDQEPVTERIRAPRAIQEPDADVDADSNAGADAGGDAVANEALAHKSFPPPVPRRPSPSPGSSPGPAAATAEARRHAPEPITATIRKWQPAEEPRAATEPIAESMPVPVAPTVPLTEPEPETPTETVFSTGSVSSSESIPTPEPLPARESKPTSPSPDRASTPQPLRRRRGGWGVWLFAAALGLGLFALFATGLLDRLVPTADPAVEPAPGGIIDVGVVPSDAQIFVFVGRGPAMAHDLSVGRAHEFVVFDQGLRPSRAVVPADAQWGMSDSGPFYELAVQAPRAKELGEATNLGVAESDPSASIADETGTIRVVTNPPLAKVYRYVGTGPSARIPVSSIHEGQEVLVYHPDYETRRAVIGPSDWKRAAEDGDYAAELTVQLPLLPASPVPEPTEN